MERAIANEYDVNSVGVAGASLLVNGDSPLLMVLETVLSSLPVICNLF